MPWAFGQCRSASSTLTECKPNVDARSAGRATAHDLCLVRLIKDIIIHRQRIVVARCVVACAAADLVGTKIAQGVSAAPEDARDPAHGSLPERECQATLLAHHSVGEDVERAKRVAAMRRVQGAVWPHREFTSEPMKRGQDTTKVRR